MDPSKVIFCVEGGSQDRIRAFLRRLGMTPARDNSITAATLVVITDLRARSIQAVIDAAAELGKRVCIVNGGQSGVDAAGKEWFHTIEAFETFMRAEAAARKEVVPA